MEINGYTRMAAVVARPIKHSISPFIQNFAFREHGVNAVYLAWDIAEEDLEQTLKNIRRYDMVGVNISMPYKQAVLPFLDELSPAAALIGAVNCIAHEDGKLIGHNTDGQGFLLSLARELGFSVEGQNLVILGGGGAATAIVTQAALDGAKSISIFRRTSSLGHSRALAQQLTEQTGAVIDLFPLEDSQLLEERLQEASLLVNATSVGMDGQSSPLGEAVSLPDGLVVADIIYQPFETPLLKRARKQGLPAINGLGMLLYQAALSFKIWTGLDMPTEKIWAALEETYKEN